MADTTQSAPVPNQGWVSSPNQRGTKDILLSCLLTLLLCIWTSVLPNVPPKGSSEIHKLYRKFELACLATIGPEFLFVIAAGQLASALRSKEAFRQANYDGWTLRHAFFADMGGFILRSPDEPDFAIDAKQLLWLIQEEYVEYPNIGQEVIDDKNKFDGLSRTITLVQGLWFTLNTIFRPIQGLTITNLELTTLTFILMMIATSFCWYRKPGGVTSAIVVEVKTPIKEIREKCNRPAGEYYKWTPLDYLSRQEYSTSLGWGYYAQILSNMHIRPHFKLDRVKPRSDIPEKFLPISHFWLESFGGFLLLSFLGMYVIPWNFSFPTPLEKLLWRVSSLVFSTTGAVAFFWLLYWHHKGTEGFARHPDTLPEQEPANSRVWHRVHAKAKLRVHNFANSLRNITPEKDPQMDVSLVFILAPTVLAVAHIICRFYIIVEDFMQLRCLPPDTFDTVNWTRYLPHL